MTFEDEVYSVIEEIGLFDIRDQEETIKLEELKKDMRQKDLNTNQDDLQNTRESDERSGSEDMNPCATELEVKREPSSCDENESDAWEDKVDPYALALPFKSGDKLEAIPPENRR